MADCGCIKGNYQYIIGQIDKKTISYQDISTWMNGPNFKVPDEYYPKVTLPTSNDPVYLNIDPSKTNVITSKELYGKEGMNLPDGIYCFTIDEISDKRGYCGQPFTRTTAVTTQLQCCYDNIVAKLPTLPQSAKEDLDLLDFYMKSIHTNTELNKPLKAQELFKRAQELCEQWDCACR